MKVNFPSFFVFLFTLFWGVSIGTSDEVISNFLSTRNSLYKQLNSFRSHHQNLINKAQYALPCFNKLYLAGSNSVDIIEQITDCIENSKPETTFYVSLRRSYTHLPPSTNTQPTKVTEIEDSSDDNPALEFLKGLLEGMAIPAPDVEHCVGNMDEFFEDIKSLVENLDYSNWKKLKKQLKKIVKVVKNELPNLLEHCAGVDSAVAEELDAAEHNIKEHFRQIIIEFGPRLIRYVDKAVKAIKSDDMFGCGKAIGSIINLIAHAREVAMEGDSMPDVAVPVEKVPAVPAVPVVPAVFPDADNMLEDLASVTSADKTAVTVANDVVGMWLLVAVGSVVLALIVAMLCYVACRRRKALPEEFERDQEMYVLHEPMI